MAFAHTSGEASSIINFFSIIETWLVSTVGWTLESGAGTQDLVFSSNGEAADKTMLFARFWRDNIISYPQRFYSRVQNDAIGTQNTGNTEYISALGNGSVAFRYWVTANKDAVVIVFKSNFSYYSLYTGLLEPYILSPPDETYYMACCAGAPAQSWQVLRGGDGTWNVYRTAFDHVEADSTLRDKGDDTYALQGSGVGTGDDITGQPYFISGLITSTQYNVKPHDTGVSEIAGATANWIILGHSTTARFALQTSGTRPTGTNPNSANFAATRYVINSIDHFFTQLRAFLGQVGWSETDLSGTSGYANDWVFSSTGESGIDTVYIRVYRSTTTYTTSISIVAQTDATTLPANKTTYGSTLFSAQDTPTLCYFIADLDLFGFFPFANSKWRVCVAGLAQPARDDLPDSTYYTFIMFSQTGSTYVPNARCLRDHEGNWDQLLLSTLNIAPGGANDSPSAVDGVTHFIWPEHLFDIHSSPTGTTSYGRVKYLFHRTLASSSVGDTLTDSSARDYTILYSQSNSASYYTMYAIRTDPGIFSSSSSSSSFSSCSSSSSSSSFSSSSFSSSSSSSA